MDNPNQLFDNKNPFFIVGLRASGTSILRQIISRCPEVGEVEFEPHDLEFACSTRHLKRYRNSEYHESVIGRFRNNEKIHGAKIALNTGIEALNWRFLDRIFSGSKFVFVKRNPTDNYLSLRNKDKNTVKGALPQDLFVPLQDIIVQSFIDFCEENGGRSCLVDYDKFVLNPDKELKKVGNLLNITIPKNLNNLVHRPKYWSGS